MGEVKGLPYGIANFEDLRAKDRKVATLSQGTELHLVIMQVRAYELVRLEEVK